MLSVTFDVAGRSERATYIGVDTRVAVKDGKFGAQLIPPNRPEFALGEYVVEVLFTPRGQSEDVLSIVGVDGENLKNGGDSLMGFRTLEVSKPVSLELTIAPYPMESPASYPGDSPQRAVAEFLGCWQQEDWNRMVSLTQKTWRQGESNPAQALEWQYGFMDLLGARIEGTTARSDVMVEIRVTLYYALGAEIRTGMLRLMVLWESAAYTPSTSGDWGVEPIATPQQE
jgi:hypothetical protein